MIKLRKKGRRGERGRAEGKMGGQERGREGQRDIGQHIKFTAKSLNPLGGKVELREAKGSRVFATTQVKKKKKM